jgi:hypothetical protein
MTGKVFFCAAGIFGISIFHSFIPMKKILVSFAFALIPLFAQAAPASTESIEQLLATAQVEKMVDSMLAQMDGVMKSMALQALDAKKLSSEDRRKAEAKMNDVFAKITPVLKSELSWPRLKDMYVQIYRESLTQEEVDGLIAFYGTSAGKALLEKMPIIMQKSMAAMQQRMAPMMQEMEKAMIGEAK